MEKIKLKAARIRSGMRQVELAKLARVSPGMLSRYECGWLVPTGKTAERIAGVLGMHPEEILEFEPLAEITDQYEGIIKTSSDALRKGG